MRMSQVVIIPTLTERDTGKSWSRYNEWDVLKGYLQPLLEHLDEDRIKFIQATPGSFIEQNSLVIYCNGGWSTTKVQPATNTSVITYGNQTSKAFAERLKESIYDWGKCYIDLGHRISNFAVDETLCAVPNTVSVSISPFKLHGPNAETYMKRLEELGRIIEACIFAYLISRSELTSMMRVSYD